MFCSHTPIYICSSHIFFRFAKSYVYTLEVTEYTKQIFVSFMYLNEREKLIQNQEFRRDIQIECVSASKLQSCVILKRTALNI